MKAALRTHVEASETGESVFAVRMAMGDHRLIGDEPVSVGGAGLGPNPFELLAASLAECTAMTVRWFANERGWPPEHVAVTVDHGKKLFAGAAAAVDVFDKTIAIRGPLLSAAQHARLLEIANRCPVQRILEGNPMITAKARSVDSPADGIPVPMGAAIVPAIISEQPDIGAAPQGGGRRFVGH